MNVGVIYSRIREDEKLLLTTLRERGHEVTKVDVRDVRFGLDGPVPDAFAGVDLVVNRCMESSRARYAAQFCDAYGVDVVNGPQTTATCADKVRGSLALAGAGVPTPRTEVAFDVETALETVEAMGYPCVLKPVVGSWGRLVAKLDTRAAAEAVLEHKDVLGHYEHKVFYVQEFVEKPGRDVRVLMAGGEPVSAMTRSSEHWITNAARGGETDAFELDDEAYDLAVRASDAVGGGLLGVDMMELPSDAAGPGNSTRRAEAPAGYTVHEVNATVEFKAMNEAVPDVDVPERIVDWLETRGA